MNRFLVRSRFAQEEKALGFKALALAKEKTGADAPSCIWCI
jgi:hypothetical protein